MYLFDNFDGDETALLKIVEFIKFCNSFSISWLYGPSLTVWNWNLKLGKDRLKPLWAI